MKLKIIFALGFLVLLSTACKKPAGPGGKNSISGTVVYKNGVSGANDAAPMATITIAYGTSESTSSVDKTILTDTDGKFTFEGLRKGKYFIKAGYTDAHGFSYNTAGYGVSFEHKKKNLDLNIILE